jgi:hypothetical protein
MSYRFARKSVVLSHDAVAACAQWRRWRLVIA